MPSVSFTGACWISTANELPELEDGCFGGEWTRVGQIGKDEAEFWKQFKQPSRRSVGFYISIFREDMTVLPPRFWLGVEWLTDQLYVATTPAVPRALARRAPEVHPGLRQRPCRHLSAHVAAGKGQPLFKRLR
ncbi:hypothetical protein [Allokutzneria oryzae]|uniref:Uncharacterized protein n=1 Tax=Allokutzneria oryzae TaxID=1378989 RepID=A0ABV6A2T8_9PSEU